MLPFRGLSACLSHVQALCSNSRRYWHDFFCIWQPRVSTGSIWLTAVNTILPKLCPKVTHSCRLERRRQPQIAAEWLEIALWSQWRPLYRKPPSLFQMVHFWMVSSLTPYDLPFPQNKGSYACERGRLSPNYFGPCCYPTWLVGYNMNYEIIGTTPRVI